MKKLFSILSIATLAATASFAQSSVNPVTTTGAAATTTTAAAPDPNAPDFQWTEETHDFGTIPQGKPVTNRFEFVNTGKEPLIISNVQKTCGCTVTDWTKEPIMPGQKGFVSAEYNAAKEGAFTKAITVVSNSKNPNVKLFFKGTVEKTADTGSVPEQKTIFTTPNNQ